MWDGVQWHPLEGEVLDTISKGVVNAITIDKLGFVYFGGWL